MDSLSSVEKEIDKADEAFESFYTETQQDMDKLIEFMSDNLNQLIQSL
jgi:hypothetical protein